MFVIILRIVPAAGVKTAAQQFNSSNNNRAIKYFTHNHTVTQNSFDFSRSSLNFSKNDQ